MDGRFCGRMFFLLRLIDFLASHSEISPRVSAILSLEVLLLGFQSRKNDPFYIGEFWLNPPFWFANCPLLNKSLHVHFFAGAAIQNTNVRCFSICESLMFKGMVKFRRCVPKVVALLSQSLSIVLKYLTEPDLWWNFKRCSMLIVSSFAMVNSPFMVVISPFMLVILPFMIGISPFIMVISPFMMNISPSWWLFYRLWWLFSRLSLLLHHSSWLFHHSWWIFTIYGMLRILHAGVHNLPIFPAKSQPRKVTPWINSWPHA